MSQGRFILEDAQPDAPASGRFVLEDGPPAVVQAGKEINSIPRQIGLTARYGLEGLANAAQLGTEPLRYLTDRVFGQTGKTVPLGVLATQFADKIGLPAPENATERVVGDASRLMAGAGGMGATARAASAAPGVVGRAGELLSANMPQQITSAAGAGLAGGMSREAGGSPLMQAGASLLGGVVGGTAPGAVQSTVNGARNVYRGITGGNSPQQIDVRINALMERAGVDYSQIPERARQSLRQDLARAMNSGQEVDPAAVRRLADFRVTGLTPTRGAITQDPVQITREMNLAKTGANSADAELQGLARVQNQNNTRLIDNLNQAGAAQGDPFLAGQAAIGGIHGRDAQMEAGVNGLYRQMREMAGGDIPLDRKPFIDNIFGALDRENRMAFLPKEIGDTLNAISSGRTPFTPQTVDMLKTMMATASRSSNDGNVRAALTIARNALESTPVNLPSVGPGLVTGQQAQALRGATAQANDVLDAMNQARRAAAQRFGWQESARPIEAALGGAQPDNFVRQFVINGTVADASAVAQNAPREVVRDAILQHVKQRALGGASDEVGKVSQSAFNKALNDIGDRKLSLFFTPEELTALRANARVASYVQVQPVGSAVNNSNTGALLLGKGLDALNGIANGLPVIGPMVAQPVSNGIRNLNVAIQTQRAQNVAPGLLVQQPRPPIGQTLLLPGAAYGGLLAAPK